MQSLLTLHCTYICCVDHGRHAPAASGALEGLPECTFLCRIQSRSTHSPPSSWSITASLLSPSWVRVQFPCLGFTVVCGTAAPRAKGCGEDTRQLAMCSATPHMGTVCSGNVLGHCKLQGSMVNLCLMVPVETLQRCSEVAMCASSPATHTQRCCVAKRMRKNLCGAGCLPWLLAGSFATVKMLEVPVTG